NDLAHRQTLLETSHHFDNAHIEHVNRRVLRLASRRQIHPRKDQNGPAYREDHKLSLVLTPCMKAEIFCLSFIPLAASTPLETSTAHGRVCFMACDILSGLRPPERIKG